VFLILGSIYAIQWASTLIPEFLSLFITVEDPELINTILSVIPYPLSQSSLIALFMSPNYNSFPMWISTVIGMGLFVGISYYMYRGAFRAIQKVLYSEPRLKPKQIYFENVKKSITIKPESAFTACLRKDLLAITRDMKMFLSIVLPILLTFIFIVFLNIPNFSPTEPLNFQIFRIWMSFLLVSPILSGILVFNLLSLEESGQSMHESLPLIPRDQARAKILIMFIVLTLAILLPSLLFVYSYSFMLVFSSMVYSLPFAWFFLFLAFELRILLFGKRNNSYVVGDVLIGNKIFKWITIFVIPLSISAWIISMVTLLYDFADSFNMFFTGFIILVLMGGFTFVVLLFRKLFPKIHLYEKKKKIPKWKREQTFVTQHVWISIILILFLNFIFSYISFLLNFVIRSFIPPPYGTIWIGGTNFDIVFYEFLFRLAPFISFTITFGFLYLFLIPRVFGIHPNQRKKNYSEFDNLGSNLMKIVRIIMVGLLITLIGTLPFIEDFFESLEDFLFNFVLFLIYSLTTGFWLEIIYRGVILNVLTLKYRKDKAINIHLGIIFLYSFLLPVVLSFINFSQLGSYIPLNFILSILRGGLYLLYTLFMSLVFTKSKKIWFNLFVSLLLSLPYLTFLVGPIYPIPYYADIGM
jgi:hypothetical protein